MTVQTSLNLLYGLSARCFSPRFDLEPASKLKLMDPQLHHLSSWVGDNVQQVYCVAWGQIVTETGERQASMNRSQAIDRFKI